MTTPEQSHDTSASDRTTTPTPTPAPSPVPPPVPVETHPNRGAFKQPKQPPPPPASDTARLAPEDAYKAFSPPRLKPLSEINGSAAAAAAAAALRPAVASLRAPPAIPPVAARLAEERRRSASRRRKQPRVWKKLLWVKQHGFPDNYTDTETFLDHLQRNPRLRPYDFWPLVADATVIVQHVCSVTIFVCAYAGIYQDRLSPTTVVTWGTVVTLAGWFLWDRWMGQDEAQRQGFSAAAKHSSDHEEASSTSSGTLPTPISANGTMNGKPNGRGLGLSLSTSNLAAKNEELKAKGRHGQTLSNSSFQTMSPISPQDPALEPFPALVPTNSASSPTLTVPQSPSPLTPTISARNQARLKTFKSALLIYFALLGLSPILKSLTKSTSSDSIWALATWLLMVNIFFFDYRSLAPTKNTGRPVENRSTLSSGTAASQPRAPPFPSSLSTNAALMASTVLASRLPSTSSVFSLTLFSIQVFGLFPVFRRHLRSVSMPRHVLLTTALILLSTASLNLILSQSYTHTYGDCGYCLAWLWHVFFRGFMGIVLFGGSTVFMMGACSWWLIGLQRYKNVVIGPWDTAKPVLAGGHSRRMTGTD